MKKYYPTFTASNNPFDRKVYEQLGGLVDNSVLEITIPTPKRWKCKKKDCPTKVKHTHSTYVALKSS